MVKECKKDRSNCLVNAECHLRNVSHNGKTKNIEVCLCKKGFKIGNNDTCVEGKNKRKCFCYSFFKKKKTIRFYVCTDKISKYFLMCNKRSVDLLC